MEDNIVCAARTKILKHTRYRKTKTGRKRFVRDSLDSTPVWIEIIIILILLPVLILLVIYAALKWLILKLRSWIT